MGVRAGLAAGPSTGTNLWGIHHLTTKMAQEGPLVTVISDGGESYRDTHLNPDWSRAKGLDPDPYLHLLDQVR